MAKLIRVLEGADLRCKHFGLRMWAKETHDFDFGKCRPGEIVVFLNNDKSKLALLPALNEKDSSGFLGSYNSPHGRVPPEALEFIAEALGVNGFDMKIAIRKGLEKLLQKRGHNPEEKIE